MHNKSLNGYRRTLAGIALAFVTASAASAQSRVVLPAGSVIIVRTTAPLQSASVKQGQMFETNVEESVGVDEFTVIPAGSKIRGVVDAGHAGDETAIGCHRSRVRSAHAPQWLDVSDYGPAHQH